MLLPQCCPRNICRSQTGITSDYQQNGGFAANKPKYFWEASDWKIFFAIITYLKEEEARKLIVEPVDDFFKGVYDEHAVQKIIDLTHCQAYWVQLMCYELI